VLRRSDFETVDSALDSVRLSGEFGFTLAGIEPLRKNEIDEAVAIIERLARPTWFDRHVWRL
jgi:hypothetical protein